MSKAVKEKKVEEKIIRLTLPIPEKVYNALKAMSEKEERSLTSQIIYILKTNSIQEESK